MVIQIDKNAMKPEGWPCFWFRIITGFVQNYCLLIGDKSFSNFQKVSQVSLVVICKKARLLMTTTHLLLLRKPNFTDTGPKRNSSNGSTKAIGHFPFRYIEQWWSIGFIFPHQPRYGFRFETKRDSCGHGRRSRRSSFPFLNELANPFESGGSF